MPEKYRNISRLVVSKSKLVISSVDHSQYPSEAEPFAQQWRIIFWTTTAALITVFVLGAVFKSFRPEQFIFLARSFSQGRLSVDEMPLTSPDYVIWQGHVYLPPGPLPAVLLIPFLPLIDLGLQPAWISIFFTLVNIWLLYLIFDRMGVYGEKQQWMLLLFFGGTVYFSVASTMISWYFGHVVATTCLLLGILEIFGRKRPLALGLLLGLAGLTRLSIIFALPFFIWFLWPGANDLRKKQPLWKQWNGVVNLLLGLFIPLVILLAYNYARFGNVLETGYGIDVVGSPELEQARNQGLFSVIHIPRNLYFLLLQGPLISSSTDAPYLIFPLLQPSPMGMGIFFTSPALLLAFRAKINAALVKACWLAIACLLIPLLTHYATGWIQFGYRYSLDFMPFLILIVSRGASDPLKNYMKGLIVVSVLINLWGTAWLQNWV